MTDWLVGKGYTSPRVVELPLLFIKNTLANLPKYYLSMFPILGSVAASIEKLKGDFLWGGIGEECKHHLVSWSKVCAPIS